VLKVMHVVGARPNFPKTAPIMAAMAARPADFQQTLVHTGQHYDYNMSAVFFEDLNMPKPDEFLDVGSASHAQMTAKVMVAFESVVLARKPQWVMVVGDVNSTIACALVCSKLGIKVAHVEAGLRSRDRTMPEEINRLLTDQIADLLFTPSRDGDENLLREGVDPAKIKFVGNVMIDTLVQMLPKAIARPTLSNLQLASQQYVLATLHRPSNVDEPAGLTEILRALGEISNSMPVVFPVHPRTAQKIQSLQIKLPPSLRVMEPLGYLDFMALVNGAKLVVTDSGGIQEETTYLGVPCLTVRPNTERPVTISQGTNRLVDGRCEHLLPAAAAALKQSRTTGKRPELWDGHAAQRIAQVMASL
jgi:UDP-N-acetylglucosamine 2-epimerase (non-hydrolysing)